MRTNLKTGNNFDHNEGYAPVIEGFFPKEETKKQMAIKRVNGTLSALLLAALVFTGVNYYFATTSEMVLNELNREIVVTNDENSDLQYKLDKMKSYTNVGNTVQQNHMLKKAEQVIEVPLVKVLPAKQKSVIRDDYTRTLGY